MAAGRLADHLTLSPTGSLHRDIPKKTALTQHNGQIPPQITPTHIYKETILEVSQIGLIKIPAANPIPVRPDGPFQILFEARLSSPILSRSSPVPPYRFHRSLRQRASYKDPQGLSPDRTLVRTEGPFQIFLQVGLASF